MAGESPFYTSLLWWPDGVSLWFQTWDIPAATAAALLSGPILSDVAIYNLLILATFPLSGLACYFLLREVSGGWLGPLAAGSYYTFSAYHFAHAQAQLHIASMQWSPLVLLAVLRTIRTTRLQEAAGAGAILGVALLSSIYHFVFSVLFISVLLVAGAVGPIRALATRRHLHLLLMSSATFAASGGWLLVGMVGAYLAEPHHGGHDSVRFSADVQAFVVPNAVSAWSTWFPSSARWTGTSWENAAYIGYVPLALACFGAYRVRLAQASLVAAAVGVVLALGPVLHVGGQIYPDLLLPTGVLERLAPAVRFSGLPTRFTWLTTMGIAVAAGIGAASCAQRGGLGRTVVVLAIVAGVAECWPGPLSRSTWPTPPIMRQWAHDPGDWAVLDTTEWGRQLSHQIVHRRPIVGGYISRVPSSRWSKVRAEPLLAALLPPPVGRYSNAALAFGPTREVLVRQRIRYVVIGDTKLSLVGRLGLVERYRGDGVAILEVPY